MQDIIVTDNPATFNGINPGAKDKILNFLETMQQDNVRNWASINTIAKASKVSDIYTRTVLKKLCVDKAVECGERDRKIYFRLVPKTTN